MSSRAFRKANKASLEDELMKYANTKSESSDEEQPVQRKAMNAFAFLEEEEDEEEETERKEHNDNLDSTPEEKYVSPDSTKSSDGVEIPNKKNKKKKNQKNKFKSKTQQQQELDSDEELDKIIEELQKKEGTFIDPSPENAEHGVEGSSTIFEDPFDIASFEKSKRLLQVRPKDLNPDTELMNLFGDDLSSRAIEDADSAAAESVPPELMAQIRKMAKLVRGWGGKDRKSVPGTTRKLVLTKVKDFWIPTKVRPMSMQELSISQIEEVKPLDEGIAKEYRAGIRYFKFSDNVNQVLTSTQFFKSVVMAPNHEALFVILQRNPYHVPTILQVSSILMRQGDKANSNSLVERALFVFEWAMKQNFEIGVPNMRLPYEFFLNRQFYLAIFRYIQVLTARSTFYTALKYCIWMLSLNPKEDPLGVRYFIDFYAIMSGEYQYLIDFCGSPLFHSRPEWMTTSLCYSKVLALLLQDFNKNNVAAKEALQEAFELHPLAGVRLYETMGMGAIAFDESKCSHYDAVAAEIYMVRAQVMWGDSSEIKGFVRDELSLLISELNGKNKGSAVGGFFSLFFGRKTDSSLDPLIPVNLLRHVILSGESKAMAKVPSLFWDSHKESTLEFDVLPTENAADTLVDHIDQVQLAEELSMQSIDESWQDFGEAANESEDEA